MKPFFFSRPVVATMAVLAIALTGVVVAPAPAAHAAPTARTCTADTFVWRTGVLHEAVATAGVPTPTAGPALVPSPVGVAIGNLNAIAIHPITNIVYANNVGSPVGSSVRVINPDGTVEDLSATVPLTNATTVAYAGGTFTPDGHWLMADANGRFANVDLTSPASPTYGQMVFQGTIRVSPGGATAPWLSGDMAYRASDDRIYFTTWGTTIQVGSIPRSEFFATADIVPTFGPTIVVPGGARTSGAASGFDSAGNLWMSTNLITVPPTVPAEQSIWRVDSAALTGVAPIVPANPITMVTGSGTDGFMCLASPITVVPEGPTLAATGLATEAPTFVGAGLAALLAGLALMVSAGVRRRKARV